jgi:hypothetical protein
VQPGGVVATDLRHRQPAERGQDVLRQQLLVVADGARLELRPHMLGHPLIGEHDDGGLPGRRRFGSLLPLDDGIGTATHVGDRLQRQLACIGDR